MNVKVAVIIPSRGLMHSRTAEEIVKNTQGVPHQKFFAHKLPIPECFEWPLRKALKDPEFTHIWFVEDDMMLPHNILREMLNAITTDVLTCDYPAAKDGRGVVFKAKDGQVVFGGLGCTLVKRKIFDKLEAPYFRTDVKWRPANLGTSILLTAGEGEPKPDEYGMQDVNFYMKLRQAGATFEVYPQILGQRKLLALGQTGSNDGAHQIEQWEKVKPNFWLKHIAKFPKQPASKLKTVVYPDGSQMNVGADFASKLVKEGRAELAKPSALIVDFNGVEL